MKKYLRSDNIVIAACLFFYAFVIFVAGTGGRFCGEGENVPSCLREWTIALGGIFGAISVFVISIVALGLEQSRDATQRKQNGREYALDAIRIIKLANDVAFSLGLYCRSGVQFNIEKSFIDAWANSCANIVDGIVETERKNIVSDISDYSSKLLDVANKLQNKIYLSFTLYSPPKGEKAISSQQLWEDIGEIYFDFAEAVEKYAVHIKTIANEYGVLYLPLNAPMVREVQPSEPTPPLHQT